MNYILIGKINGTHGLKGELKLKSDFLYKDKVLKKDFTVYIGKEKLKVRLEDVRRHNDVYLICFKDYLNIDLVHNFKNKYLYVKREDLGLESNEYVFEDYLNLDCFYNETYLGKVSCVEDCGLNNYVLLIKGDKEILIPINDRFIKEIVLGDKIIFKDVEGLIDANWYFNTFSRNV